MLNGEKSASGGKYEITFIVPEEVTQEPVSKILESIGAKVLETKAIGVKSFAYPIAKHNIGRYFCLKFEIEAELLAKLEKSLKIEKSVLRHLIVRELRVRAPRPPKPEKAAGSAKQAAGIKDKEKTKEKEKEEKIVEEVQKPAPQKIEQVMKPVVEEKSALVEKPVEVEKKEAPVVKKSKEPKIEIDKLDEKLKDLVGDE